MLELCLLGPHATRIIIGATFTVGCYGRLLLKGGVSVTSSRMRVTYPFGFL